MRPTLTIERRQLGSESFVKNETILSVKGLKTEFVLDEGTAKAVDGVSFEVDRGQVVGHCWRKWMWQERDDQVHHGDYSKARQSCRR